MSVMRLQTMDVERAFAIGGAVAEIVHLEPDCVTVLRIDDVREADHIVIDLRLVATPAQSAAIREAVRRTYRSGLRAL